MAGLGNERHNCVWKDCRGPDENMVACNDCEGYFHKSCRADFLCTRLVKHIDKLDEDGLCGEPDFAASCMASLTQCRMPPSVTSFTRLDVKVLENPEPTYNFKSSK